RRRRLLLHVLVTICVLVCGGAAWWFSRPGDRTRPVIGQYLRLAAQKIAWAKARIDELRHQVAPPPSPVTLPGSIETATGPMVLVSAGRFVMGSSTVPNEGPVHTVYLPAFYLDKYEVSNGRYRAFTDSTGYSQPPAPSWDPDYFAKSSQPV